MTAGSSVGSRWALPRAATGWRRLESWFIRHRWELLLVAFCTGIAAFLRIYRIADLPPGLHGDEAWTGLDALRINDEGWIGPYVGSALGQPSGPLYFTAFIFKLSHASIFTLRLSMAILGVATVPLAYLLFRPGFGRWVAIFATVALTFSYWHIHFSRVAFMIISMPMIISLAALATLWAIRSARKWPWFLAGLALGAGVYSYGGYLLFPAAVAILLAVHLALHRRQWREHLLRYLLMGAGFVLIALPMIQLVVRSPDFYFSHTRQVSLLRDPEFANAEDAVGKAQYVARRAWRYTGQFFRHPAVDFTDALGGRGVLDPVLAVLAYLGFVIALIRWRSPPYLLAALAMMAGLVATVTTVENWGGMRRSLIVVPFVYGLAGVAAREIVLVGRRSLGSLGHTVALFGVAAGLIAVMAWNTWYYFGDFTHNQDVRWVFADDLVDSFEVAHGFNKPGTIYFYSDRWSYNYETRLFLYPDSLGVDRSRKFGLFSLAKLDPGPVTYVLLPPYDQELDGLRETYPDGEAVRDHDEGGATRYAVYHVD